MARTRIRSIVVDGIDYRWAVSQVDPGHVKVTVWPEKGERSSALEVVVVFDDPWLNYGPIITAPAGRAAEVFDLNPVVPALVAKIIRQVPDPRSAQHGRTTRLRLSRDRERLEPLSE